MRLDDTQFDRIEGVLGELVLAHETLLALAGEHRAALTGADPKALGSVVERTGACLERIAALEDERRGLVCADPATPGPTLAELADLAPADRGGRVRELGGRLRSLLEKVRLEHGAIREASESLAGHMRGLMRQVSARLSHAGTYSAGGTVDPGRQQVVSGLDVRS
ncbi:MAG: flagellar protein FlgN [Phycisphaerales bacterium JB040]